MFIAYSRDQSDSMAGHMRVVCNPAQNFKILQQRKNKLGLGRVHITANNLIAQRGIRIGLITCWIIIEDLITVGGLDRRLRRICYGLARKVLDEALLYGITGIR